MDAFRRPLEFEYLGCVERSSFQATDTHDWVFRFLSPWTLKNTVFRVACSEDPRPLFWLLERDDHYRRVNEKATAWLSKLGKE